MTREMGTCLSIAKIYVPAAGAAIAQRCIILTPTFRTQHCALPHEAALHPVPPAPRCAHPARLGSRLRRARASRLQAADPSETGVTFANTITTNDSLNVQTDVYVYNGAGVAVGDIDNDGLPDIFFAGNMVSSRLYLNKGHMRFDDITDNGGRLDPHDGRPASRWWTSTTTASLDIYVSVSGPEWSTPEQRANQLFVNNGNRTSPKPPRSTASPTPASRPTPPSSTTTATGASTCFCSTIRRGTSRVARWPACPPDMRGKTPDSYQRALSEQLQRDVHERVRGGGHPAQAGLRARRRRRRPERRWLAGHLRLERRHRQRRPVRQQRQRHVHRTRRATGSKHASFAGMGVDIADFNNDGWPDILQVDMMPHDAEPAGSARAAIMTYASMRRARAAAASATTTPPTRCS